jgi:hypothetical protein
MVLDVVIGMAENISYCHNTLRQTGETGNFAGAVCRQNRHFESSISAIIGIDILGFQGGLAARIPGKSSAKLQVSPPEYRASPALPMRSSIAP